ncbi:MAG: hypothetical protein RIS00_1173 [Pseudomonadota bacterium]|jgi:hypothetical protein
MILPSSCGGLSIAAAPIPDGTPNVVSPQPDDFAGQWAALATTDGPAVCPPKVGIDPPPMQSNQQNSSKMDAYVQPDDPMLAPAVQACKTSAPEAVKDDRKAAGIAEIDDSCLASLLCQPVQQFVPAPSGVLQKPDDLIAAFIRPENPLEQATPTVRLDAMALQSPRLMAATVETPSIVDPAFQQFPASAPEKTFAAWPFMPPAFVEDGFLPQLSLPAEAGRLDMSNRDWTGIVAREMVQTRAVDGTLSFKLAPDHLGSLDVLLTKTLNGLTIELRTTSEAATQAILADQPRLLEELRQKGIMLADYSLRNGVSDDGRRHQSGANAVPYLPFNDADRQTVQDQDQARSPARGRFA